MNKRTIKKIGIILVAMALCLAIYNIYSDYLGEISSKKIISQLPSVEEKLPQQEENLKIPVKNIDGIDIIGRIKIPKLERDLPVAATWSDELMKKCPNRYRGEKYSEPLIILAHNYRSHFGGLGKLSQGDEIEFIDVLGRKIKYKVEAMEVIDGDDVERMTGTDFDLTLFTCTLDRTTRFTIRASRT
ncbi:sortase [Peptoniphilus sp.]|jgi:sortase A|uniref:sortase n=1 Tax=Peptoniphilus sp. TaxID=1971214 RepID=UPI003D8CA241